MYIHIHTYIMCSTHARRKYDQRLELGLVTSRANSKRRPVREEDGGTTSDEEPPTKRPGKRRAVTAAPPAVIADPAPPAVVAGPAPPPETDAGAPAATDAGAPVAQAAFQVLVDASTSQALQTPRGEETSEEPAVPAIPPKGPPTAQDLGLTGTGNVFGFNPPAGFVSCGFKATGLPPASSSSPAPAGAKPRVTRARV